MLQHRQPSLQASAAGLVDEACCLPLGVQLFWNWKSCLDMGEQRGFKRDDGSGQVVTVKWVDFTFVDLDAHGPADWLAIIKLGRDNKHATQRPDQQTKHIKQETKQTNEKKKKGEA